MTWQPWMQSGHPGLSSVFTLAVLANFAMRAVLTSRLYLFALPCTNKGRGGA